jgi:hypothetical protein
MGHGRPCHTEAVVALALSGYLLGICICREGGANRMGARRRQREIREEREWRGDDRHYSKRHS